MFAILRTKKLHGAHGVAWAAQHNHRERDTPNANPERTPANTVLAGAQTTDQVMAIWRDRTATVERKIRSNAVTAIEYMVTASPDAFERGKLNDGYFRDALKWVEKRHGKENILTAVIHRDETTPHLHVLVVPIHKKTKKYTNRVTKETTEREVVALDAKSCLNGPKALSAMQTAFASEIGASWGLKRGAEKSSATHEEIAAWYARMKAEAGGAEKAPAARQARPDHPLGQAAFDFLGGKMSPGYDAIIRELAESYMSPHEGRSGFQVLGDVAAFEARRAGDRSHAGVMKAMARIDEAAVAMLAAQDAHRAETNRQRERQEPNRGYSAGRDPGR